MTSSAARAGERVRTVVLLLLVAALITPALGADAATAPRNTVLPKVTGTVWVGKTLAATVGTWVASPAPTFTYVWQRCTVSTGVCVAIAGATKPTYVVVLA